MYENIAIANINTEVNGIELSFDGKPPYEVLKDLKSNGFRWHNKKQIWYAKNTSDNVKAVVKYVDLNASDPSFGITSTGKVDVWALQNGREGSSLAPVENKELLIDKTSPKTAKKEPECMADYYDSVGSTKIYKDSTKADSFLWSVGNKGYYSDINAYVWCNYHSAVVIELDNAMKRGKECKRYSLYTNNDDIQFVLSNECKIKTPRELYNLVVNGTNIPESCTLTTTSLKGVEVFSPFVAVKPLDKMPEKWRKSDLVKAIMSGQVFDGTLDERLTDDYAYDAAWNFGAGTKLHLPGQAADLVEGCRDCYIHSNGVDENGIASIHFSYAGDMKTFLFDINCDLAESIVRKEKAQQELQAHNSEIKNSVKHFTESEIDPAKVYIADKVIEDGNTGKLGVDHVVMQGFAFIANLDFEEFTGFREASFVPDKLYKVANFYNRRDHAPEDARIVDMGNWGQVCSGKAVEELTKEGVSLHINTGDYENPTTFEAVKKECMDFIEGKTYFMFGNSVDYSKSLDKLVAEEKRVSSPAVKQKEEKEQLPLDSVIGLEPKEEKEHMDLDSIIGFAEARKAFEASRTNKAPVQTQNQSHRGFDSL